MPCSDAGIFPLEEMNKFSPQTRPPRLARTRLPRLPAIVRLRRTQARRAGKVRAGMVAGVGRIGRNPPEADFICRYKNRSNLKT
jgi:hypothetical protein